VQKIRSVVGEILLLIVWRGRKPALAQTGCRESNHIIS